MEKLKGIKLVTFDMDGTTLNDEWAHEQAKVEISKSIGGTEDVDLADYTGKSNRKFWTHVLEKFNLEGDIEDLTRRQFHRVYELCVEKNQRESEGLADALRYLKSKGIKTAITSGSDEYFVDDILKHLNLTDLFDIKVSKEQVKEVKPAPDIYLKAIEFAGVKPEEAIGVEDSNAGCTALHAAGMRCIGFRNNGINLQSLAEADVKIQTMYEIIDLVE